MLTLVCPARTHSDVADVTRFDDIMKGLHLDQFKLELTRGSQNHTAYLRSLQLASPCQIYGLEGC